MIPDVNGCRGGGEDILRAMMINSTGRENKKEIWMRKERTMVEIFFFSILTSHSLERTLVHPRPKRLMSIVG